MEAVTVFAVVLAVALVATGGATLGGAVVSARARRRQRERCRSVDTWFAERVAADTNWESAVAALSPAERETLTALLAKRLEDPSREQPPQAREIAAALGVDPDLSIRPRHRRERLTELNWAVRLGVEGDPDAVAAYVTDDRDERETAARLLLESETSAATRVATDLLLCDGPLSVFGVDTLYRHHRSDAGSLLRAAAERRDGLCAALTEQVLVVAGTCASPANLPAYEDWLDDCLAHEDTRVRTAAKRALDAWDADELRAEHLDARTEPTRPGVATALSGDGGGADAVGHERGQSEKVDTAHRGSPAAGLWDGDTARRDP